MAKKVEADDWPAEAARWHSVLSSPRSYNRVRFTGKGRRGLWPFRQ